MLAPSGVGFMVVYMQAFGDALGQQSRSAAPFFLPIVAKRKPMKKEKVCRIVLLALFMIGATTHVFAQKTSTFKSNQAHLSISYNSSFRALPIRNASHMLLHLQNDKNEDYTISFWEYGIDDSYDVWNPDLFSEIKQNAMRNKVAQFHSCNKVSLSLKGKTVKAVEIVHTKSPNYIITYQWLWRGNLIQIVYVNEGTYGKNSAKGKEIIQGIQLL